MTVSIIIPCFNESSTIPTTANAVLDYMKRNYDDIDFELILVNDGSTDGTDIILDQLARDRSQIRAIHFERNRGRGAAIKKGIAVSRNEFLILLDADLSYDVPHIGAIIESFRTDHLLDVVVISPYMKGGRVSGVPAKRLLLSRLANWILAGFFENNLSTVTCVVRGYRGSLIRELPLFESGKELHLEILRKCAISGARILEVPGHLAWRDAKARVQRKGLKVFSSGMKHIWWGVLIKPTRIIKYLALFFIAVGLYETAILAKTFFHFFEYSGDFWIAVWRALAGAFSQSPHSVVIACISILLGFQSMFFIILFQVLKLQQEESMKHLLAILVRQNQDERI